MSWNDILIEAHHMSSIVCVMVSILIDEVDGVNLASVDWLCVLYMYTCVTMLYM